MKRFAFVVLCLFFMGVLSGQLIAADKYSGTPAARAEFEKGRDATKSDEWEKAVAAFKKAIELDPNYAEAYSQLGWSRMRLAMGDLTKYSTMPEAEQKALGEKMKASLEADQKQYEELAQKNPKMPIYKWVLAERHNEDNPELQEKLCKEAVALDPDFTPGYECLAAVSSLRGDGKSAAKAQRKVIALKGDDKESWRRLQWFVHDDAQEYKKVTTEIVNEFPGSDTAVQALITYAETLPTSEQTAKLEELVAKYPPKKFSSASGAASTLFEAYDRTDPVKAAAFAHKILSEMPEDKSWKSKVAYADSMAAAEAKVAANDGEGALTILKDVKTPGMVFDKTRLQLLKAKAQDVSGKTADGYAELAKIFAAEPAKALQAALYVYGKKLGKDEKVVNDEVWNLRSEKATPAIPFTLESFIDGKKISLDDFKGKVVLLDFWYPNCGPCMRAMPYLQALYSKYKDSGLVFLGVNGIEGQDPFVMPLVKSRGWGFIPLKSNSKWAADVYKVKGYPTTFLIGADGKVYFKPHTYNQDKADMAAMQIEALLKNTDQAKMEQLQKDRAKEMEKYLQSLPKDVQERQKAMQTVYSAKGVVGKAEAAVEFFHKYPGYNEARNLAFNVFYERKNQENKAKPEEVQLAIKKFMDGTKTLPGTARCDIASVIAGELDKRGILTNEGIDISKQGIALLNQDDYVAAQKKRDEERASYRKNDPKDEPDPFSLDQTIEHYKAYAAGQYSTLGNLYVKAGKTDLAEEAYKNAYKIHIMKDASVGLSKIAEQRGDSKKAFDYYVDAMLNGKLNATEIAHLSELHGKVRSGGDADLQQYLDDVYRSRYKNPLSAEPFKRTDTAGRAVVAELVTGAGCEPCMSVDMAFEVALKKYPRTDVILLAYDWHAPTSDPLSNYGVESRVKYYGLNGAPSLMLDGKKTNVGEGAPTEAERVFANLNKAIQKNLAVPTGATIKLSGRLNGGKVEAKATVSGLPAENKNLRLYIALVSQDVSYSGENGLRFHPMVMRNLARPAGAEAYGFPVTSQSATIDHVFDLEQIAAENLKYYDWYNEDLKKRTNGMFEGVFKEKRNVVEPHGLSVVAFVQDNETKEILQGVYAEVPDEMPASNPAK